MKKQYEKSLIEKDIENFNKYLKKMTKKIGWKTTIYSFLEFQNEEIKDSNYKLISIDDRIKNILDKNNINY